MQITVNGAAADVESDTTVAVLVNDRAGEHASRVAVAIDAQVVPRSQWNETRLRPGASIELLTATAGG